MASLSKAVSNRQWFAEHVITTMEVHAPGCIGEAERQLSDPENPEATVDLNPLVNGLTFCLKNVTRKMAETDLFVGEEIADDPQYRESRDSEQAALRSEYISIKDLLSSVFGDSIVSKYGLNGETPTNTELLLPASKNVSILLKKNPLPVPLKKGIPQIDSAALALNLDEKIDRLEAALRNVKREEKELELAVRDRDISIVAWQKIYSSSAIIFAEILKLGGRNDLAERVRPTARKLSGSEEPPADQDTSVQSTGKSTATVGA